MYFRRTDWRASLAGKAAAGVALLSVVSTSPALAQAPAAAAPVAAAQANVDQASYRINTGDELEIYVWGEERLQRVLRVLPDGSIAFPLVGQIKVQGMLPQDVERLVSERLKGQYRGEVPNVTVSVRNPSGMQFSVMGKVRSPGAFTPGRYINVLDAITMAGGPAEFANLDSVSIIRNVGGRLTTVRVRLGAVFKGGVSAADLDRSNVVPLAVGDIVIVP